MEERHTYHNTSFYRWLFEVGTLLKLTNDETANLIEDISWLGCYDDGMTPKEAIEEFDSILEK